MKIAIDHKRLHLRFLFGTGFVIFVIKKIIKSKVPESAEIVQSLSKDIKRLLKSYKRANGRFTLLEVEEKDNTRIVVRI